MTTRQAQMDNFGTEAGQDETISSPLYPFRDTETTWWTSDQVRNPKSFGYTYPELDGVSYPTTPADKAEVLKRIKKLYSPLPMLIQQSKAGVEQAGEILLSQSRVLQQLREDDTPAPVPATAAAVKELADELPPAKTLLQQSIGQDKPYLKDLAPHNKYLEWIVNIKSEKHTLGGAYTVHVFLGPPPEEGSVDMWPLHAYHVGTFSPLGQGEETACSKCQDDQADHTEVTGQIPLTIALVERYLGRTISDITEATAVPYLRDHLHWRVVKVSYTPLSYLRVRVADHLCPVRWHHRSESGRRRWTDGICGVQRGHRAHGSRSAACLRAGRQDLSRGHNGQRWQRPWPGHWSVAIGI